jgi:TolA-binding protein
MNMKFRHMLFATAISAMSLPAMAQDANVEGRVVKLEKEMRAVQRQVFPGGAGKIIEPDIKTPDAATVNKTVGSDSNDIQGRVDALEQQLASLTGQVEKQGNAVRTMEARLKSLESQIKEQAASGVNKVTDDPDPAPVKTSSAATKTPAVSSKSIATPTKSLAPAPTTSGKTAVKAPAKASATRTAAVAKIAKPESADPFDDSYSYGYRLWEANFYPEAQIQLQETIDKWPKKPLSKVRNLLGRAWLDDNKPATAVKIFYDNYKGDPRGERAPDSLMFLGYALTDLGKKDEACGAFSQLVKAYPTESRNSRIATRLASGKKRAGCS